MSAAMMPIEDFVKELDEIASAANDAFEGAVDASQLDAARVEFLGAKNGRLKLASKHMAGIAGPG